MKNLIRNSFLIAALMLFAGGLMAQTYEYVGVKKCAPCHKSASKGEQFQKWSDGPHANAMASLSDEEKQNPDCLKCHATAGYVDESLHAGITVDEGVSCETCHGPGSVYKSMKIMKSREESLANGLIIPDEELCRKCHNEESPTFKGFDYEEALKVIAHPNPQNQE